MVRPSTYCAVRVDLPVVNRVIEIVNTRSKRKLTDGPVAHEGDFAMFDGHQFNNKKNARTGREDGMKRQTALFSQPGYGCPSHSFSMSDHQHLLSFSSLFEPATFRPDLLAGDTGRQASFTLSAHPFNPWPLLSPTVGTLNQFAASPLSSTVCHYRPDEW